MRFLFLALLAVLSLFSSTPAESITAHLSTGFIPHAEPGKFWALSSSYRASFDADGIRLVRHGRQAGIRFPGARLVWEGEGASLAQLHFLGPDLRSLSGVAAIRARNAYPGIDIVIRLQDGRLKSEFQLAPGVPAGRVSYCVDGASVRPSPGGDALHFDAGPDWQWQETSLASWQTTASGEQLPVAARFTVRGACVRFRTAKLDPTLPLTIDPDLVFSTFVGGGLYDSITSIATDSSGNTYIGGWTESTDFPTLSGYQSSAVRPVDAFVAKLNASGQLVFSTYLGGSLDDRILALAVDSSGAIAVAGYTTSTNFPTKLAAQSVNAGLRDAFIARLVSTGNQLVFSTYLGGTGYDGALGIAIDPSGNIVAAGETSSTNLPVQAAYRATNGGGYDGFVARFSPTGTLISSTYLGGGADDRIRAVAVGTDGVIHVTGSTQSSNFPVTAAPYPTLRGSMDAFYTRLNSAASAPVLSTFLGGSLGGSYEESGYGVAVESSGRAWIGGITPSKDFPGVTSGYQPVHGGGNTDGFVSVFTPAGGLEWSTYLGGASSDAVSAISVASGFAAFTGNTYSTNFPVTSGALQTTRAGEYDAFWGVFPVTSTTPLYLSYLGGTSSDGGLGVAAASGGLVVGGMTMSSNFPLQSALQSFSPGASGGFLTRIRFGPGPITVSPSSGSGATQTFTFTINNAGGGTGIQNAAFLFNSSFSFTAGCYLYYDRPTNQLSLFKDVGSVWLPLTPGAATTVDNGVCSVNGAGVTVTPNTGALVVALPVTFGGTFAGAKLVYANATDSSGIAAGWPQVGAWTVPAVNVAPAFSSLSPATGTGLTQTFTAAVSDSNGFTDLATVFFLANGSLSTANGCYIRYTRSTNTFALFRDSDASWLSISPGAGTPVSNTNCTLSGTGLSATGSGNALTLALPITFASAFAGAKATYLSATDSGGLSLTWTQGGSWTVPSASAAPTFTSLNPTSGSGATQTFTAVVSDANGFTDISTALFLVNASLSTANGCYIQYTRSTNTFALYRDSDATWLSIAPGAGTPVSNNNCTLSGTGLSATGSGNSLTLALPLSFASAFAGAKLTFANATDSGNLTSGWIQAGAWTIPAPNATPTVSSLSPNSGSGAAPTFTAVVSDANGFADLANVFFLVNASLSTANGCYIQYTRSTNTFALFRDSDGAWLTAPASNTNCSLSTTGLAATGSGNSLTLTLPITFASAFAGGKLTFLSATDSANASSGWIQTGSWTIPNNNAAPSVVSLTPGSGTGTSQTFSPGVSDPNGFTDIATVYFLLNGNLSTANGCYVRYTRATNTFAIYRDADATWISIVPGAANPIANVNCTLSGTGLNATGSGNGLTLALPLSFASGFAGGRLAYVSVVDGSNASSGWIQAGSWTIPNSNTAPSVTSLSPNAGSGASQTFTAVYSDANGFGDLSTAYFLVNSSLTTANGCYIRYSRSNNTFSLFRDSDSAWLPAPASNNNCSLGTTGLAATGSGNALTLAVPITFASGFSGGRLIYLSATDSGNLATGWIQAGSWTVTATATAPTVTSLSPTTGSGLTQTFTAVVSDANGFTDLTTASFLVNASLSTANGCYIQYTRSTNTFALFRDSDGAWVPAPASNTNCSLSSTGLSATGSGSTLTLALPITFASGFTGAKLTYVSATDSGSLTSGWVQSGAWTVPVPNAAPTVTSLSPTSGSGVTQTFTGVVADSNGFADLTTAYFLANASLTTANGCYIRYTRSTNTFALFRDSDSAWLTAPAANTNCSLSSTGLAATGSGNSLTLTLPVTFASAFAGAKITYLNATDSGSLTSGWVQSGAWTVTVPATAPAVTSLTPASGSGLTQTFTAAVSDANGFADLANVYFLANATLSTANGCYIQYTRSTNTFALFRDSDGAWLTAPASNTNCTLSSTGLSATGSGNSLTLTLPITFASGFAGAKLTYLSATDSGSLTSGWVQSGSWTVPAPNVAPTVTSLTPASGSGATQTFTAVVSDANGFADLATAYFLVNASLSTANGCYIQYTRSTNTFALYRDSDGAWLNAPASNANCSLSSTGLAATGSGNALTLTLPVTFASAFTGAKLAYLSATDSGNLTSGWVQSGAWTVSVPATAPTVTSLTPASGSGLTQTFTATVSDANGFTDLTTVYFLANASLSTGNGCYIQYTSSTNTFALYRDSDGTWVNAPASNTKCSLSSTGLAASGSGTALTLTLPITFASAFAGSKFTYLNANDTGNLTSGWVQSGSWTVPSANVAPTVGSITPASGSGLAQTFTAVVSDANGFADLTTVYFLANASLSTGNGCYIQYTRSTNTFALYRDSDGAWVNAPASNTNCSVSSTGLAATGSGNSLTLTLPITFTSAFAGSKLTYLNANDTGNLTSGWIQTGSWTVPSNNTAPTVTSLSPASGSGASQTFNPGVSDANGFADIATVYFLLNANLSTANGCYVRYTRSTNTFALFRDSDGAWLTAPASNTNCSLSSTGLSATGSGNSLSLALPLSFASGFAGGKLAYINVTDNSNATSGWIQAGSWTVPNNNIAPTVTSLTPGSGTGMSQTFIPGVSDGNGFADIATVYFLLNGSLTTANGCYVRYTRATNTFALYRDSDGAWLTAPASNPNCSLSSTGLSATGSGNGLTLNLPLSFTSGFAGGKSSYITVTDSANVSSGWIRAGSWTVSP